jgi:hypothetical protein
VSSPDERWLDQFLGDEAFDATRAEALEALRGHVLGTVVIERENPDRTTDQHVQGILVEGSREPETWESAELFAVVSSAAANAWHNAGPRWEAIAGRDDATSWIRQCFAEAAEPPMLTFGVPESGIVQYPGAGAGTSGFRWPLEDGRKLAVVLWQDVMHITDDGDLAPGLGGFTVSLDEDAGPAAP